jgi:hypothetical protein
LRNHSTSRRCWRTSLSPPARAWQCSRTQVGLRFWLRTRVKDTAWSSRPSVMRPSAGCVCCCCRQPRSHSGRSLDYEGRRSAHFVLTPDASQQVSVRRSVGPQMPLSAISIDMTIHAMRTAITSSHPSCQKPKITLTRTVRGTAGWVWMSSTPECGSPGSRDVK